jgi:hypothetical protein
MDGHMIFFCELRSFPASVGECTLPFVVILQFSEVPGNPGEPGELSPAGWDLGFRAKP